MDENFVEPIIINTDNLIAPSVANSLWENRINSYFIYNSQDVPKCTIAIQGYNRLDKTKYCVECVLDYTQDVDYELILVDNGSDDGTYEYFQSVPFKRKKIIRVTKNIGSTFPSKNFRELALGKYIVIISNDVYVTKNWLSNLLRCYESDPTIGLVLPLSSNVSNNQQLDFDYQNFEEMQTKAAAFNQSDPTKWEERMRLISLITITPRSVLDLVGNFDPAFIHDFGEDDYAVRLRRAGFKLMLCKDTWICHDHDFRNLEDKDPEEYKKGLESGRNTYREKYHGIDAWDDINNYDMHLLSILDTIQLATERISALSVDPRCGTPVLEIRNHLKRRGVKKTDSYAFTTQAKYYTDLLTVANDVKSDRIDFIQNHYNNDTFNIVYLGEPVNTYPSPITLLQKLYQLLKSGGVLFFKLRNVNDINNFMISAGIGGSTDPDMPANLPLNELNECLRIFGATDISISAEQEFLSEQDKATINGWLTAIKGKKSVSQDDFVHLTTKNYLYCISKG